MPKFTLIAEHKDMFGKSLSKTTHEFEVDFIGDVLENVDLFLRGAGFYPTGILDYQEEYQEEYVPDWSEEWETPQEDHVVHSNHYFDTERNKK